MLRYFFFLFLLLLFLVVKAETLTVCASGCDYVTIEGAVNLAVSGDTIDIQAGTFTESDIFIAENLTIRGQGPTLTIVQAADRPSAANGRVFFVEGEFTVSIENLTVRHGVAVGSDNNGGRIQIDCGPLTDVQLVNLIVSDNYAGDEGGGIHSFGSGGSISLTNCIISDNEANGNAPNSLGGGIYHSGAKTFILNRCSIVNNRAGDDGGGIYSRENSSVLLLTSCTLANNTIGSNNGVNNYGAGIFQRGTAAALRMINCTVVENSIIGTGEGLGAGVSVRAVGEVTLTNTIITNNTMVGTATTGKDLHLRGTIGALTQTTSLVVDCAAAGATPCPTFSYTDATNIASTPSTCGLHTFYDVTGSDAEDNGTPAGGDIPTEDICGNPRSGNPDIGAIDLTFLPVDLANFRGQTTYKGNELAWETVMETNNQGFSVERSTDSRTWKPVGFVAGHGNSTQWQEYTFLDPRPHPGQNYYRLRQVDYDGTHTYSNIIGLQSNISSTVEGLVVFPNPTTNSLYYRVTDLPAVQSVQLLDLFGRSVRSTFPPQDK